MKLYDIAQELQALEEILMENGGEVSPEFEALSEQLGLIVKTKTDSLVWLTKKLEDEIDMADRHIERIKQYKQVRKNAIESLRKTVTMFMDSINETKIKGDLGEISIRKPVKSLSIESENLIPAEFKKVVTVVDNAKVKDALKSGLEVPGARLVDGKRLASFKMKSVKG